MNFKIQHLPAILLRDLENPKISWKIVGSFPHPKTEQEMVKETIENLPQSGQAVLETNSVIGSGELRKIMEKGGSLRKCNRASLRP